MNGGKVVVRSMCMVWRGMAWYGMAWSSRREVALCPRFGAKDVQRKTSPLLILEKVPTCAHTPLLTTVFLTIKMHELTVKCKNAIS